MLTDLPVNWNKEFSRALLLSEVEHYTPEQCNISCRASVFCYIVLQVFQLFGTEANAGALTVKQNEIFSGTVKTLTTYSYKESLEDFLTLLKLCVSRILLCLESHKLKPAISISVTLVCFPVRPLAMRIVYL